MNSLKSLYACALCLAFWSEVSFAQQSSLSFNGTSTYVDFGAATSTLGASNFTVECWFKRIGTGTAGAGTGGGGVGGTPIVSKGRGESESPSLNCNYYIAYTAANKLTADFEEVSGPNHPLTGTITITSNVWHHVALTYNGTNLILYLDGVLDNSVAASGIPDYTSIQHAGIGTSMNSVGTPSGFFAGNIDEVRIWNYARSQSQIQASMHNEITAATGLLGRWGLNDGTGTNSVNSVAGSPNGTNFNNPVWTSDSPFNVVVAPQTVSITNPVNNASVAIGSTVTVAASATSTGTISKVEFFADGISIGESTTSPYTVDWIPGTEGTIDLTAVVSDDTALTTTSTTVSVVCYTAGSGALQFNGYSSYVTFGQATSTLGTTNFTLECWFKRTGKGILANTGIGGTSGAPLIAKGVGEADASNRDANYFFGIDTSGRLVADFEEGSTGGTIGLNHPIGGHTAIPNGTWTHAAVTYDGFTWVLYINGVVDATLDVNQPPRWDSIQHAAIGAALNSGGVPQGFFEGAIDEARIWNYARSADQIYNSMNNSITNASGLIGRWSLDDGAGAVAINSVQSSPNGTLVNSPVWCEGVSLTPATNTPPSILLTSPADGSTVTGVATNLIVLNAFAADNGVVTNVTFYQDSVAIGTVTNPPFNLVWTNYTPGVYSLFASAIDDTGLSATSSVVNVTVIPPNYPPTVSTRAPASGANGIGGSVQLSITGTDPEAGQLTVTFRGRPNVTNPPGADFTIVALPDTQFYNGALANIFQSQVDWIIANRQNLNIVYVGGLGDIVNDGDAKPNEWLAATNALYRLDDPVLTGLPNGIPYGTVPGNHDHNNAFGGTTLYNTYFGVDHFINRPWYGGHPGGDNQNHFDLLTVSGLEFVFVYIDFDYGYLDYTAVDPWSASVLKTYSDRRAIVLTHDLLSIGGAFDPRGQTIFDNLKTNENLFLMLCGHNHGQYFRQDTVGNHVISTCLSDYQDFANGGNGFLRTYTFSPSNNVIHVDTYSPYLDQYLGTNFNNSPSTFDISYQMSDAKPPYQVLGTVTVNSGAPASVNWSGLSPSSSYEWSATVSDGVNTLSLPASSFSTGSGSTNIAATLNQVLAPSVGDPRFRARYTGTPGGTYTVEKANQVTGPWVWKTNVVAPAVDQGLGVGTFEFNELPGTNSRAFFRIVTPAYTP